MNHATESSPTIHRSDLTSLFVRVAEGSVERERNRVMPHEQVEMLRQAGIGALRLPVAAGGAGMSLPELFGAVIDLAAADSNVAHLLRSHFGFVEEQLQNPDLEARRRWLGLIRDGHLVGNAVSEQTSRASGRQVGQINLETTLARDEAGALRLNGVKFYSTGSIFATWINVHAIGPDRAEYQVVIPVDRDGVTIVDDWDGFGQRLTGTGTTRFDDVLVHDEELHLVQGFDGEGLPGYTGGFYQLYLQAVTAGILAAVQADAVALIRRRGRNFTHAFDADPVLDPQLLAVVGEIASDAVAARAIVLAAVEPLQDAFDGVREGISDPVLVHRAQIAAAQAKVSVDRFATATAARLLDVGGASATQVGWGHDRHWRNIRTLSTHNPAFLKATAVGDYLVNGTPPPQNGYF